MVTQCLNTFFFCIERIKQLQKAEYTTMFIAILFLIAKRKKKKKTVTQRQEKRQIMVYSYNSINKELKSHTSTWINLKNIKLSGEKKKWKNTSGLIPFNKKSPKYKPWQNIVQGYYIKAIMKIKGISTKFKTAGFWQGRKQDILGGGTVRAPQTVVMFHFLSWVADICVCFTTTYAICLW